MKKMDAFLQGTKKAFHEEERDISPREKEISRW